MIASEALIELEQHLRRVSEIGADATGVSNGLGDGRVILTRRHETGEPAGVGDLLFATYAGIEGDTLFNLNPGHDNDEQVVESLVAPLPELAVLLQESSRLRVRDFLTGHKNIIHGLAEALMNRRRLMGDEAKAVAETCKVSKGFLDTVDFLSKAVWLTEEL
jgi:hypothetical protein